MKRCRFPLFLIGEIHNCRKESGLSKRGVNVAAKKAEKNSAIQKKFYISQIETTKRIIKTFSETTEFSPAMLINSLLSLVILPYERAKESGGGRIFPGKYPDLIRKIGISPQIFTPIQSCSNGDVVYNRKTIYTFDQYTESAIIGKERIECAEDAEIGMPVTIMPSDSGWDVRVGERSIGTLSLHLLHPLIPFLDYVSLSNAHISSITPKSARRGGAKYALGSISFDVIENTANIKEQND